MLGLNHGHVIIEFGTIGQPCLFRLNAPIFAHNFPRTRVFNNIRESANDIFGTCDATVEKFA